MSTGKEAKVHGTTIFTDELPPVPIDATVLLFCKLGPGLDDSEQGVLVFLRKLKLASSKSKLSQKFHAP